MSTVVRLNMADTAIKNIEDLRGRGIQELDIRHCVLDNFLALHDLPRLKKLTLSSDALIDDKELVISFLREQGVEIIVE